MYVKKWMMVAMACTLLLSGCGSKEKEREISKNTGKEYFKVGMTCDLAPFATEKKTQSDTSVTIGESYCDGYDVKIARKLAEHMNMEIQVKKIAADAMQEALDEGEIDAVISGLYPDEKQNMDVTKAYQSSDVVLLVRKDDKKAKSKDLADFKGSSVAALQNTSLDAMIDDIKDVKHEKAMASYEELIKALKDKKIDAMIAPSILAENMVDGDLTMVKFDEKKGFRKQAEAVIGMKKGSKEDELFLNVQKALDAISQEERDEMLKASK